MGRGQQVVGLVAVLQTEDVVAVFLPAVGGLIRLARQQSGEVDFLGVDGRHLLADDVLDLVQDIEAQRQPGPDARSGLAQVAGALQQLVRHDVGIGGVLAQGAQEHGRHTKCFGHTFQITQVSRLGCATRPRIAHQYAKNVIYRVINKSKAVSMILESAPYRFIRKGRSMRHVTAHISIGTNSAGSASSAISSSRRQRRKC